LSTERFVPFPVDNATASTEFYVDVHNNEALLNETRNFVAGESFDGDLTLDPPLDENATLRVAIHDPETGEELNTTNVTYNVTPEPTAVTATLNVTNQTGNGTTLAVENASAGTAFYLNASVEGDTLAARDTLNETETFAAGESFEGNLTLEPALESNDTVRVTLVDAETDERLNATNVSYTVVEETTEGSAIVDAANQTHDGTNLTVDNATAETAFYVNASVNGTSYNETRTFDAGESFEGNLSLDPALGETSTVRVAVHDADTDEELNATNVTYTAAVTGDTVDALDEYEDVEAARDAGYVDTHRFDSNESGVVGVRFINTNAVDDELDPREPEVLLYTINDTGEYELLGAEWTVPELDADERPTLFDESFDGPLPAHTDEFDEHYGLYAWLFEENPDGEFEQRNSALDEPDLITVENQTGDGQIVTVDRIVFAEEYVVEIRDQNGAVLGRSDVLSGEQMDVTVTLDTALTADATLNVSIPHTDTGAEIGEPVVRETIGYTVETVDGGTENETTTVDGADSATNGTNGTVAD
jgi:hypothetical protein